jgi:hypothetical protein
MPRVATKLTPNKSGCFFARKRIPAHYGARRDGRDARKWLDTTLGDPCYGPITEGRGASAVRDAQRDNAL